MKAIFFPRILTLFVFSLATTLSWAEGGRTADPTDWLLRAVQSSQSMTYSGVYTFSHDGKSETSRIMHIIDAEGEHGKLESLDGPPREIIRENDHIACYLPESHMVKLDRIEGRRFFPALLSGSPSQLRELYNLSFAGTDRVAGRECRLIRLDPKDGFRFSYRLCADSQTGLLLRASMEDGSRGALQTFTFTEFIAEGGLDAAKLKPSWNGSGWTWDRSGLAQDQEIVWVVSNPPQGFHKVIEMHRGAEGRSSPLIQMVYTDGLATVSVFIEPARSNSMTTESRRGALSFYSTRVGDQQVTAIGEVPPATVAQLAKSAGLLKK
jgi:sigma-E factor negative regulatory protein RseB